MSRRAVAGEGWELSAGRVLGEPARLAAATLPGADWARDPALSESAPGPVEDGRPIAVRVVPDVPALSGGLDYLVPPDLASVVRLGSWVRIPLKGRRVRGWVVGFPRTPHTDMLKPIRGLVSPIPVFGEHGLALAHWLATSYATPLVAALRKLTPPAIPAGGRGAAPAGARLPHAGAGGEGRANVLADSPGARAAGATAERILVEHAPGEPPLERVVSEAEAALARGESVLLLVPEAEGAAARGLRPMLGAAVTVSGSGPAGRRAALWAAIATGRVTAVTGGHSAAFAPLEAIGLIAVFDEEHPAYKEEQSPLLNVRDVAAARAALAGARLILCSSAPSLRARALATHAEGAEPGRPRGGWPRIELVDMADEPPTPGSISERAVDLARTVTSAGRRVLFFVNRKGEGRALRCLGCHAVRRCGFCGARLARSAGVISCSRCDAEAGLVCPACGSARVRAVGATTASVEKEASRLLPRFAVARVDRDTPEAATDAAVVVGTEAALWRSGQFDLVVMVDADSMLYSPDAFAEETAFRTIAWVASRARRSGAGELLLIQTLCPSHRVIRAAVAGRPEQLAAEILPERQRAGLPPFVRGAVVTLRGGDASHWADEVARVAERAGASVAGPDRDGEEARVLLTAFDFGEVWRRVGATVADARVAGCRVRFDADPLRLA